MRRWIVALVIATFTFAGCAPLPPDGPAPVPAPERPEAQPAPETGRLPMQAAVRNFTTVVRDVEPVAERVCREQTSRGTNCDFLIAVDDRTNLPPNAFHTLDGNGRPVIGFTLALIRDARNRDELAFILGHEASHHIEGHIPRGQQAATTGAALAGILATLGGADEGTLRSVQNLGAQLGSRRYAKDFELEADRLGARIALRAGYDPIRGAEYFMRIDDPGNAFLGTHPPNADRIDTVRRAVGGS